jgi:hypothetical protein
MTTSSDARNPVEALAEVRTGHAQNLGNLTDLSQSPKPPGLPPIPKQDAWPILWVLWIED